MTTRNAKLEVCAVMVTCPHCDEVIENPVNGALNWTNEELLDRENTMIECSSCGKQVKIPAVKTFLYKVIY